MRKRLTELRERMKAAGVDMYIVPTGDWHGSEYVNDYFKCREYVSGFTGSAGTLLVEQTSAKLWTDGRYFLQAKRQLEGSGIELMKMGMEGVPDITKYIMQMPQESRIGFDGRVLSVRFTDVLARKSTEQGKKFRLIHDIDLVGEIWNDRPQLLPSQIYELPPEVTGKTTEEKLARLRREMTDVDYLLVSRLEDIAWLYNLRGHDVAHTPVFYSYALISRNDDTLYVMDEGFGGATAKRNGSSETVIPASTMLRPYRKVFADLASLRECTVMLDEDSASCSLSKSLDASVNKRLCKSPVERLKAVKNEAEIAATKNAHIRDGLAMVNFLYWLKTQVGRERITEMLLAEKLEECRREQGAYDLSFDTIAGYEAHGAIIHYSATPETDAVLEPKGFVLIDSGGQYEDGTTDITRTVALGALSAEQIRNYTAVLKGHIALASARFTTETTGAELDAMARRPLKAAGLDFNHGTGHGVGHMLSVHEGPNTISPRGNTCSFRPGMITSDEPGVYLEGKYGIRIENELLCIAAGDGDGQGAGAANMRKAGDVQNLRFENLTLCPYERKAIETEALTEDELLYINRYHAWVYETLSPKLASPVRNWLAEQCRELRFDFNNSETKF